MTDQLHKQLWDKTTGDISKAECDLSRLDREISEVRRRIEGLKKLLTALSPFVDSDRDGDANTPDATQEPADDDGIQSPLRHADMARAILTEAGGPLDIHVIINQMLAKGHPLPENFQLRRGAVYSAMSRRVKEFERIADGRWQLKIDGRRDHERAIVENSFPQDMSSLAEVAFRSIGGPATAAQIVEKLEELGYRHKKDKRQTYRAIHKAFARQEGRKFRKLEDEGLGVWGLIEGVESASNPRLPLTY